MPCWISTPESSKGSAVLRMIDGLRPDPHSSPSSGSRPSRSTLGKPRGGDGMQEPVRHPLTRFTAGAARARLRRAFPFMAVGVLSGLTLAGAGRLLQAAEDPLA